MHQEILTLPTISRHMPPYGIDRQITIHRADNSSFNFLIIEVFNCVMDRKLNFWFYWHFIAGAEYAQKGYETNNR